MLANTGLISFLLYGVFILITIAAMAIAFYLINSGKVDPAKLDKMIELFKYAIVSTAIATATLAIADLFKEREQDVKELEYFDKYVNDVKKVDGIQERIQLVKYLTIVAPSGELKKSWSQYYDSVKIEYREYLILKAEKEKLDTLKNPTKKQELQKAKYQQEIYQKESPIVSNRTDVSARKDTETAKLEKENGFNFLLKKDVVNAIESFVKSENAFNGYDQVYEISRYLKEHRVELIGDNSGAWKKVFSDMANKYSYGMPSEIKNQFLNASK